MTAVPAKSQSMSLRAYRTPQWQPALLSFSCASHVHLSTTSVAIGIPNLSPKLHRESTFLVTPCPLMAFLAIVTGPVVKSLDEENIETQSPVFKHRVLFLQTLPSWTENALKQKQNQPTAYTKHAQMFPLVMIP